MNIFCVFLAYEIVENLIEEVLGEGIYHGVNNKFALFNCTQLLRSRHETNNCKNYHVHKVPKEI